MLIEATSRATPVPGVGDTNPAKRVLWKWSLALTAVLVLVLMWQCGAGLIQGRRLANTAVRQFHQQLNDGRYDDICRGADEDFVKREELTKPTRKWETSTARR